MAHIDPIRDEDSRGILRRSTCSLCYSSANLGWDSLFASVQYEFPFQADIDPVRHHLLVFHRNGGARVSGYAGDKAIRRNVPAGGIYFWPAHRGFGINLESSVETMHLYLHGDVFDACLRERGGDGIEAMQLLPEMCVQDALLLEIGTEVSRLMESKAKGVGLYIDTLALAISERLISRQLKRYVSTQGKLQCPPLSPVRLHAITEYVDVNLCEEISLSQLCALAGMSASHFVRRFNAALGQSPYQFVLSRRIESAKRLLARTDRPIADIALDCGFSHQEHLTNAFRRRVGTTPAAYRKA
ncbi:AraC family transcriptional regulator [Paraburkholderia phytofirmans]|uniref:AraC family transcriptional regulator n=1 Tax=Paraburkholderia phytofirmans TaxID=261302 RepID=UPI0007B608DC|nr:AraC family transcriptional regulator [Paraburkholderia phytofirmans]